MVLSKEQEAQLDRKQAEDEALPSYEAGDPGPSTSTAAPPETQPPEDTTPQNTASEKGVVAVGPTIAAPFDFPSNVPLPPYSEQPAERRPLAIPQSTPQATAPFVAAYSPALLNYGITEGAWHALLDTLSAFLAAKVSDRALRHAGDMAKHAGRGPTSLVKGLVSHAKKTGSDFSASAKKGDVVGATFGTLGNGIALTMHAVWGTVGAAVTLPGNAVGAVFKKPQTPRARADAYLVVVNKDWLAARGLEVRLLDGNELARLVGMSYSSLLAVARSGKPTDIDDQLKALDGHIEKLEYKVPPSGELGDETLWLVVTPAEPTQPAQPAESEKPVPA